MVSVGAHEIKGKVFSIDYYLGLGLGATRGM